MARKKPATDQPAPPNPWPARLKALRSKLEITQREAAERTGVALRTWICWENNQRRPRGPSLSLLLRTFPELQSMR